VDKITYFLHPLNYLFHTKTILLIFLLFGLLTACKQTKYVTQGSYLLKKNSIHIDTNLFDNSELNELIRQQPNYKSLGLKSKLIAYTIIDPDKVHKKRIKKNEAIHKKNELLQEKEAEINRKRIARAKKKQKEWYTQKIIPLKDTVEPNLFFREWLKYKFGEAPVIFDSLFYQKSIEQIEVFLRKKGFYYGSVKGEIEYKKNRKAIAHYFIETGPRYIIDSVKLACENPSLILSYDKGLKNGRIASLKGQALDADYLDKHRNEVAEWFRNDAFYSFNFSNIDYRVDTNSGNFTAKIIIRLLDREIQNPNFPDSIIRLPHRSYLINDVFFHILDTTMMRHQYLNEVQKRGLSFSILNETMPLLDTMLYEHVYLSRSQKRRYGIAKEKDTLNAFRIAHFYYNGRLFVRPGIIEMHNHLEHTNYYKQYSFDQSYTNLLQIDLFSSIKPQLVELPDTNLLNIHYYLTPAPRQYVSVEPRATNSNGFLGVSASLNYSNRNFFRGAEQFVFALSGGFESEPPIFDTSIDGKKIIETGRSLNTFEFEPSVKLNLPGLFPLRRATHMRKGQRARTILSASWNFQTRDDFTRKSLQFGYMLRFYINNTQIFHIGLPLVSVIKFVNIEPSGSFQQKINALNDVFLRNTYSDQFVWQDWKFIYEYNTLERRNKLRQTVVYNKLSFDAAGNILSLFSPIQDTNSLGQRTFFALGYSQFVRLDNDFIFAQPLGKKHSIHFRVLLGVGFPYGNTKTSMPYDYSFFGGGANDNRGWRARSLGPGSYKYYLDSSRTAIQMGDIRIAGFAEYRFSLGRYLKGAVFSDMGNIWTWNKDDNRPGSQFSEFWYRQLATSVGLGVRLDFGFVVGRLDLGFPIFNPALPSGSKWIVQSRNAFYQEINAIPDLDLTRLPRPFIPVPSVAIGYPF